ncbi:hypothetical protein J4216_03200 [Candidatus Woesearchaeota archaeon]|nr:hypothetical protein [Candidatus Woesearchaeota archaeon]
MANPELYVGRSLRIDKTTYITYGGEKFLLSSYGADGKMVRARRLTTKELLRMDLSDKIREAITKLTE